MLAAPLAAALLAISAAAPPSKPAKPAGPAAASEAEPGCVQRSLRIPDGTLITRAGTVRLTVAVGEGGEAGQVRVPGDVPAPLATALRAAIRACAFTPGRDAAGAPVTSALSLPVRLAVTERPHGDSEVAEASAPVAPAASAEDGPALPLPPQGQPAREEEAGCVAKHLRLPPNRLVRGLLTFTVPVAADGQAGRPDLPPELDEDVADEVRKAVGWCRFLAATTPEGGPLAAPVSIRIRFAAPGDEERQAQAGSLSREARLASNSCLQRLGSTGLVGHVVVSLRVSERGRPSEFRIQPENTPATLRISIFDVLSLCPWEPALDLDGRPVASTTSLALRYR